MTLLPIIQRELLVQARRPATHRLRVGTAAAGLLGFAALLFLGGAPDSLRGQQLYLAISSFGLAYALFAGVLLTADTINEERAQGTLGLLFLTDLRPRDILLGKLIASSLNGVYVLVGLLPLLGVPLLFGGVALGQVAGHAVLLVVTLVLSLAVGLGASRVKRETGQAISHGLASMAAFALVPLALAPVPGVLWSHLAMASPVFAFFMVLRTTPMGFSPTMLVASLALPLGFALLIFVRTTKRLTAADALASEPTDPSLPLEVDAPTYAARWGAAGKPPKLAPVRGARGSGSAAPPGLLETDPILWLLWRRNRFPRAKAAMLALLATLAVPMLAASFTQIGWYVVTFMGFVLHLLAVSHMASQACQRIRTLEDREALELLLTTPRAARGTLNSYHRAFCQLFQMQFLALVVMHGMLLLGALLNQQTLGAGAWVLPAIALAVLFAERSALSWVGLSLSLRHGRYHRAHIETLFYVLFPSWGAVAFAILGPGVLGLMSQASGWWVMWCPWLLTGWALPLVLAAVHRRLAARWLQEHGAMGASVPAA